MRRSAQVNDARTGRYGDHRGVTARLKARGGDVELLQRHFDELLLHLNPSAGPQTVTVKRRKGRNHSCCLIVSGIDRPIMSVVQYVHISLTVISEFTCETTRVRRQPVVSLA